MFIFNPRWSSPVLLSLLLGSIYWLRPDLSPEMFGVTTPDGSAWMMFVIFLLSVMYLVTQGYPVSYGDLGTSGQYNIDNIISFIPVCVAIVGFVLAGFGFRPLSQFNIIISAMVLVTTGYDLWILGGAAAKVNRLTDELKDER